MKIWTVDAFTDKTFAGNPAAVTIVEEFPSDEMCQKIAAEMNLSETAFIKPLGSSHFHIRWFTPEVEVKLCGHATLASAHILFEEGIVKEEGITFDSLSGPLFVTKESKDIILDFPLQKTGEVLPLHLFKKLFKREAIVNAVKAYDDVIVELVDETLIRELKLDPSRIKEIDCRTLIVTAKGNPPYDCVSRIYAPQEGINEDPVTGSAHCLLVDYWQQKLGKSEFLAYQASPRGGILGLQIVGDRVHLRGQAVTILEGTLKRLPYKSKDFLE
ncbi:MAG: PhzF family phenazine biosynthesis protein [Alphaproteobacteria bacterium]|nr:PhzF family phenazine biosynthesis protein [Alphaproteobacteria bacterium]